MGYNNDSFMNLPTNGQHVALQRDKEPHSNTKIIATKTLNIAMYTGCTYPYSMKYEWDKSKAKINLRKHGVDFADAVISLEDENALTIEDFDKNEPIFKTLGMGSYLNIL